MENSGIAGKKWKYMLMHVFLQSPSFVWRISLVTRQTV